MNQVEGMNDRGNGGMDNKIEVESSTSIEDREKEKEKDTLISTSPSTAKSKSKSNGRKVPSTRRKRTALPGSKVSPRKKILTEEEMHKRAMKNRLAAQLSREKKRQQIEDLENKCILLTEENRLLEEAARKATESQYQIVEEHYLLMTEMYEFQTALKTAKAADDISLLSAALSKPMVKPKWNNSSSNSSTDIPGDLPASLSTLVHSSCIEDCASPDAYILSDVPSLSFSSPNSPSSSDYDSSNDESISTPNFIEKGSPEVYTFEESIKNDYFSEMYPGYDYGSISDCCESGCEKYSICDKLENYRCGDFLLINDMSGFDEGERCDPHVSNLYGGITL